MRLKWLNSSRITAVATATLCIIGVFWVFQDIATQRDIEKAISEIKNNDIKHIEEDMKEIKADIKFIIQNMATKSDIKELKSEISELRKDFNRHITEDHLRQNK